MSRLDELLEKQSDPETLPLCYRLCSHGTAETLTLEWRSGKRHLLQWSRFSELILDGGVLSLFFGDREVIFRGVNLTHLWVPVKEAKLRRVWELPQGKEPPQNPNTTAVLEIEVRRGDFWPSFVEDACPSTGLRKNISPRLHPKVH